ncbi:uncharacterized protein BX663DRAFT_499050 [Cokeromyces recurvatus]|uniref:uncharacterized protein n=1 Tax=Cokeromyces recurvatus TaxID=90255 RepID=UPI00221F9D3D|nr:uncharacterized protein BX663DRAFT_499050 [Cokeromyces recurvatus]KAI7906159.1 hypothetical protein BX663DRAFT_499050 [Cokeromyces recurvatus]
MDIIFKSNREKDNLTDSPLLKRQGSFLYLGVPIKPGKYLDPVVLVESNATKALQTMNQLASIGLNPKKKVLIGCWLVVRFYLQIVGPQFRI